MSAPDDQDIVQWQDSLRWLDRAAEDIRAARVLRRGGIILQAAFHLQQAVEKSLKALLVAARQDVRKTHDLTTLADLVHHHWPTVVAAPFPLTYLSRWYIISRYPGDDDGGPKADDVTAAQREVEALFSSVVAQVPAALADEARAITDTLGSSSD